MAFVPRPPILDCYWVSFFHNDTEYVANNLRLTMELVNDPEFHITNEVAFDKLTCPILLQQEENPDLYREVYIRASHSQTWIHHSCLYQGNTKFPYFVVYPPVVDDESRDLLIPKENLPEGWDFGDSEESYSEEESESNFEESYSEEESESNFEEEWSESDFQVFSGW